ncbi:MAG: competence/damage-inducible protein A [Proteobacteria bacterium]|nr:competence/damage-inducible protein A [Pseudomonadota bacterium]
MTQPAKLTAAVLLIGNELLSGSVKDANLAYIAERMTELGIHLRECRVIPDEVDVIVETVNVLRAKHTYVFTTGGIGPTHDDITTACVAKAFGVKVYRDQSVVDTFKKHYGDRANEATFRMCDFPEGAELVHCKSTPAPGFRMGNVYVMAGIPRIMQDMLDTISPNLQKGRPIVSHSYTAFTRESRISAPFEALQKEFPQLELGSYPQSIDNQPAVKLVARGDDADAVVKAGDKIRDLLKDIGAEIIAMDVRP